MIIVTAGTKEYADIIQAQRRFFLTDPDASHYVYDLGIDGNSLGFGMPFSVDQDDLKPTIGGHTLPPATFKPALMRLAMEEADTNELVVWLDGDCLPLLPIYPPAHVGGFDALVTLRPLAEIGQSNNASLDYLNSGVVMIRNTPGGRRFLDRWQVLCGEMKTDQGALNECVIHANGSEAVSWWTGVADSMQRRNRTFRNRCSFDERCTAVIVPCAEWNCWHLPPTANTRILHFKRGIRGAARNYIP